MKEEVHFEINILNSLEALPTDLEDPLSIDQPCRNAAFTSSMRTRQNYVNLLPGKAAVYECDKCKKRYREESKFRTHVNRNYCDYARLSCPYCNYGPKRFKNEIQRHVKSKHKGQEVYCVDIFNGSRND